MQEYPKRLQNRYTGEIRTVHSDVQESLLGPHWGLQQPDVRYPSSHSKAFEPKWEHPGFFIEIRIDSMSEYFEFPKWIFHPISGEGEIVKDADEEAAKLAEWGPANLAPEDGEQLPNPLGNKPEEILPEQTQPETPAA